MLSVFRFPRSLHGRTAGLALAVLLAFSPALPAAAPAPPGADGPALQAPLAARSLLLDVAAVGRRFVAVGERGHVLLSDDDGRSWRQVPSPTRATLTAVSFIDERHGWAVGHLGMILATTDGGETWERRDAGLPREAVLLDVLFFTAQEGFAVGAYGLCLHTRDGGATWETVAVQPDEYHLNQILRGPGEILYLAGEAGTVLRSLDRGMTWKSLVPPYEGSFYGLLPLRGGALLVHGLRGHLLRFTAEDGWSEVDSPATALWMCALHLRDGRVVVAGPGGHFATSGDDGRSFAPWHAGTSLGTAALAECADGSILAVGEQGARRLALPGGAP